MNLLLATIQETWATWTTHWHVWTQHVPMLQSRLTWGAILLALGMWLLLPRGGRRGRAAGALLCVAALGVFASRLPFLGDWSHQGVFWLLAGVTVVAGLGTISMRSPVYCALWFSLALLGTGGLFLFSGASFLGIATVIVYAGAIVVTFLFVLMLAQPEGNAYYDRISWEAMASALSGAVLVFLLSVVLADTFNSPRSTLAAQAPAAPALAKGVLAPEHVATLGGQLFSRYLVSVEVIGVLLLVALVGASAIIMLQGRTDARGRAARGAAEEGSPQ
ncbi:MAG: NADH-quinone oxidoreductase subunit J [Planctomycetia bacterium]|nr:NADH-quinone oxidoreductase subunit J [Planctomycetia bacterium]